MVDSGSVTSPCNAGFEPGVGWIAENEGVPPDIEVHMGFAPLQGASRRRAAALPCPTQPLNPSPDGVSFMH
jgi:hypothetical protein